MGWKEENKQLRQKEKLHVTRQKNLAKMKLILSKMRRDELAEIDEDAGCRVTQEVMVHFWHTCTTLV